MSIDTEEDRARYLTDAVFHTYADQVEHILSRGTLTMADVLAATRVGITNYSIRNIGRPIMIDITWPKEKAP